MGSEIRADTFAEYFQLWGLSVEELAPLVGSSSSVSEILSGKRGLDLSMIQTLHEAFGFPYEALMSFAAKEKDMRAS